MADTTGPANPAQPSDIWDKLRPKPYVRSTPEVKNANDVHSNELTPLDKFAIKITDRVGSMGFFILIFAWTVLWCGYNMIASLVPSLHLQAFDPFPAFVAYLLMSNVIQILLMPLIMVGQNLQGRHAEIRAELDFEVNKKAEKEVMVILRNLEHNTDLLIQLMKHLDCRVSAEVLRAISAERELGDQIVKLKPEAPDTA